MHGLIPRAVEEALQERGIEPVDTPNIKDVALEEGSRSRSRPPSRPCRRSIPAISRRSRPRARHATSPTRPSTRRCSGCASAPRSTSRSKDRGVADGDTVVARHRAHGCRRQTPIATRTSAVELGLAGQPAGLRRTSCSGCSAGETKTFTVHFPEDYAVKEMANTDVDLHGDGEGHPPQGAARARRRVRQGPRRVRVARRAARPRAGRSAAGSATSTRVSICAPTC